MSIALETKVAELEQRIDHVADALIKAQEFLMKAMEREDKLRTRVEALEGQKGKRNG